MVAKDEASTVACGLVLMQKRKVTKEKLLEKRGTTTMKCVGSYTKIWR